MQSKLFGFLLTIYNFKNIMLMNKKLWYVIKYRQFFNKIKSFKLLARPKLVKYLEF